MAVNFPANFQSLHSPFLSHCTSLIQRCVMIRKGQVDKSMHKSCHFSLSYMERRSRKIAMQSLCHKSYVSWKRVQIETDKFREDSIWQYKEMKIELWEFRKKMKMEMEKNNRNKIYKENNLDWKQSQSPRYYEKLYKNT